MNEILTFCKVESFPALTEAPPVTFDTLPDLKVLAEFPLASGSYPFWKLSAGEGGKLSTNSPEGVISKSAGSIEGCSWTYKKLHKKCISKLFCLVDNEVDVPAASIPVENLECLKLIGRRDSPGQKWEHSDQPRPGDYFGDPPFDALLFAPLLKARGRPASHSKLAFSFHFQRTRQSQTQRDFNKSQTFSRQNPLVSRLFGIKKGQEQFEECTELGVG